MHMALDSLAGLVLNRAQHTALAAHCQHDPAFPDWLGWNKLQIQAASVFLRQNQQVDIWRLDVDDFVRWCSGEQIAPSVEALQRYAQQRPVEREAV
ncbi:MAG: hypothetical protein ABW190_07570 [Rhizobacter sp.]